jgi:transposase-like protein
MCVNVEHMALKTRGENVRRANIRASASHPCIKLSTKDVEDIRALEFVSQSEIARAYGVHQTTISKIRRGLPRRAGRKLTNEQRAAIWADPRPGKEVAAEFGVSASLVTIIRKGASPTATLLNSREGNPHV